MDTVIAKLIEDLATLKAAYNTSMGNIDEKFKEYDAVIEQMKVNKQQEERAAIMNIRQELEQAKNEKNKLQETIDAMQRDKGE